MSLSTLFSLIIANYKVRYQIDWRIKSYFTFLATITSNSNIPTISSIAPLSTKYCSIYPFSIIIILIKSYLGAMVVSISSYTSVSSISSVLTISTISTVCLYYNTICIIQYFKAQKIKIARVCTIFTWSTWISLLTMFSFLSNFCIRLIFNLRWLIKRTILSVITIKHNSNWFNSLPQWWKDN